MVLRTTVIGQLLDEPFVWISSRVKKKKEKIIKLTFKACLNRQPDLTFLEMDC